jgi:hypothetical protein
MRLILGPTNDFPEGKLNGDDEGGLQVGITSQDGQVIIAFGKPISWLGFGPDKARQLAALLIAKANDIKPEGL